MVGCLNLHKLVASFLSLIDSKRRIILFHLSHSRSLHVDGVFAFGSMDKEDDIALFRFLSKKTLCLARQIFFEFGVVISHANNNKN